MGQAVSQHQRLLALALAQFNRLLRVSRWERESYFNITNAIESLNSVIRKATERRKLFPSDQFCDVKAVYLAIEQAAKKWTMPIRDWKPALKSVYDPIPRPANRNFLMAL